MRNYACTTQVPNVLFDELLPSLTLAELKLLLTVNRATWGWVVGPNGQRKERAWLTSSRIETLTGLSKRAITTAIAALVRRRLLVVCNVHGVLLDHADARRGHDRLYYAISYPQRLGRLGSTSANAAEVDRQRMLIIETNRLRNQRPSPKVDVSSVGSGDAVIPPSSSFHISRLLSGTVAPDLWERLGKGSKEEQEQ